MLGEIVGLRKRWFLYNDDVYYYNSDRLIGAQRGKRKNNNGQVLDSPQPMTGWYEDGFALKDREATQMWLERSKEEQLVDDD